MRCTGVSKEEYRRLQVDSYSNLYVSLLVRKPWKICSGVGNKRIGHTVLLLARAVTIRPSSGREEEGIQGSFHLAKLITT